MTRDTSRKIRIILTAALALTTAVGAAAAAPPIVGTWEVTVESPDFPPFKAIHTFNRDRTFTETTDLLATLTEGPGHGVWERKGAVYHLTFQLFAFEKKKPAGMIRVRNEIRVTADDTLVGESVVDFIAPDGTVIEGIGTGTLAGKRVVARGLD